MQILESFENIQKILGTYNSRLFLVISNTEDETTDYYYLMGTESTAYTFGRIAPVGDSTFLLSTITITSDNVVTKKSKEI